MGQIDYLPIGAQQVSVCLPGRMQNAIAPYPIPGMRKNWSRSYSNKDCSPDGFLPPGWDIHQKKKCGKLYYFHVCLGIKVPMAENKTTEK
jgi:hypothetical protein